MYDKVSIVGSLNGGKRYPPSVSSINNRLYSINFFPNCSINSFASKNPL